MGHDELIGHPRTDQHLRAKTLRCSTATRQYRAEELSSALAMETFNFYGLHYIEELPLCSGRTPADRLRCSLTREDDYRE